MHSTLVTLFAAALCLVPGVHTFTNPCIYQSYKCGFNLVNDDGNYSHLPSVIPFSFE